MNFKNSILLSFALAISYPVLLSANTPTTPPSTALTVKQAKAEGRTLDVLFVIDKNEIAAGTLAKQKTTNSAVKHFAELMIKEHGANLHKTESLSNRLGVKLSQGKIATTLKNNGKRELAALNKLQGSSFDKAYINAMVKGHQAALDLVNRLIKDSSNPLVKKHLEITRKHIQYHLKKAQAIQASV